MSCYEKQNVHIVIDIVLVAWCLGDRNQAKVAVICNMDTYALYSFPLFISLFMVVPSW